MALSSLRADAVPLSSGSFDMLIQDAGKARDRVAAYRAYRELRRSRLTPTAYTLNALLNAETRSGRPSAALTLFKRAERGRAAGWPGERPDSWTYSTAMAAAMAAKRPETVGQLFARASADEAISNGLNTVSYNLAIEARIRMKDTLGARRLLERMLRGKDGAPPPRTDTFNVMISALGERGESYKWVLDEMAKRGIEPDTYTTCALLKLQARLLDARGVWRWARKRDAAYGRVAWNHLIESHLRLGQPYRVSALLSLMEGRDRINAGGKTSAHNLYLRSLIASGRPSEAIAHFERMASQEQMQPIDMDEQFKMARRRPRWLRGRQTYPAPDAYSYTIALTAMRELNDAELEIDVGGSTAAGSGSTDVSRARKVARIVQAAESRGLLSQSDAPPAPVAHALVCACGDDVRSATALWRDYLRPKYLSARGGSPPIFSPIGEQPTAEQASWHALLRVCGAASRADEALKVVYAMKRDGCPVDSTCYSAYLRGKKPEGSGGGRFSLQGGYERLLALEVAPEQVMPKIGTIEKIRIQFSKPNEEGDGEVEEEEEEEAPPRFSDRW